MALWFWTVLISAPVGLAAYNQASQPGWKQLKGSIPFLVIGLGYLLYNAQPEFLASGEAFKNHPNLLFMKAAFFAVAAGVVSLVGALIGRVLRASASPPMVGVVAFLAVFLPLNAFYFFGANP